MYERRKKPTSFADRSRFSGLDDSTPDEAEDPDEGVFFRCVREARWTNAFQVLCDRYCEFMLSVARRYEVAGGSHSACDIVQDYLLSLFKGFVAGRFTLPSHHLRCYLAMGVHRVGIAYRRRESARPRIDSLSDRDAGDRADPVDPSVGDRLESCERVSFLARALAELPPKYLEVLHLRCVERLDHAGIAIRMSIPVASVRTFLHRAKSLLRTSLKEIHHDRRRVPARVRSESHEAR